MWWFLCPIFNLFMPVRGPSELVILGMSWEFPRSGYCCCVTGIVYFCLRIFYSRFIVKFIGKINMMNSSLYLHISRWNSWPQITAIGNSFPKKCGGSWQLIQWSTNLFIFYQIPSMNKSTTNAQSRVSENTGSVKTYSVGSWLTAGVNWKRIRFQAIHAIYKSKKY